jgi:hypothetical protein
VPTSRDGQDCESEPGARAISLLEGAAREPLAAAGSAGRDKIPNHGTELLILHLVTGGRCWVRTNVG